MSTIRETALACFGGRLPRGTGAKAQEVLDCLIAREHEIAENLIEAGVGLGATRDQVHLALVEAGMEVPDQTTAAEFDGDRMAALEAKVDEALAVGKRLVKWAKRQGFRSNAA
jgi:hypothetical protein